MEHRHPMCTACASRERAFRKMERANATLEAELADSLQGKDANGEWLKRLTKGMQAEHGRLDGMWQKMVRENAALESQLAAANEKLSAAEDGDSLALLYLQGWQHECERLNDQIVSDAIAFLNERNRRIQAEQELAAAEADVGRLQKVHDCKATHYEAIGCCYHCGWGTSEKLRKIAADAIAFKNAPRPEEPR